MTENNRYQDDTKEINLAELFWSVLRRWRSILLVMLAAALVMGGLGFYNGYRDTMNEEKVKEQKAAYEKSLEQYEKDKLNLEKKIKSQEGDLARMEADQEKAIMLFVDPYNTFIQRNAYYIDTHYEIQPQMSYQNVNKTSVITNNYKYAIERLSMDEIVAGPGEENLTARNPVSGNALQMLNVSVEAGNGMLTITLYADTQEHLNRMHDRVKEALAQQEALLNEVIGEHTLNILLEESYTDVNTAFETVQTSFENRLESSRTNLKTNRQKLADLKVPEDETPSLSLATKQGLSKALIGLVAGLVLMGLFYASKAVMQNRLVSAQEISRRYRLPVLGVFAASRKKQSKFDTYLSEKLWGRKNRTPEEAAQYIVSRIALNEGDDGEILLLGTAEEKKLAALAQALAPLLEPVKLQVGGNPNESAHALQALTKPCRVICVEEWQKSSHRTILSALKTVEDAGRENLGFVMLA